MALLLLGELARVAALGLLADDAQLEELRAEALDLFLDHGPDVEAGDDGAEAPRGRDRLQPGDSRPDDQHLGGDDGARRGDEHRQELRQPVGGEDDGLVPGDGRLGRERVHRLRARDAGDRLHRESGDAARAEALDSVLVRERLEKADQHLAVA